MPETVIASVYDSETWERFRVEIERCEPEARKFVVSETPLVLPAPWTVVPPERPSCFAREFNAAVGATGEADLLWMDGSIRMCRPGALRDMTRTVDRYPKIGALSAQFIAQPTEVMNSAQSNRHRLDGWSPVPDPLSFDCLLLARAALSAVGEMEDGDRDGKRYCRRIQEAGFILAVTSEAVARRFAERPVPVTHHSEFTDSVTLITPTGMRPQAFGVCQKLMARQTWRGSLQWVVVDDGERESQVDPGLPFEVTVLRPEPRWRPGQNTQARNLLAGALAAKHAKILFVEDDDYYAPDYVEVTAARLNRYEIVGEVPAHYYHVPSRRYLVLSNSRHASLCQTAFRFDFLPALMDICREPKGEFIDIRLWHGVGARGGLFCSRRCVGIKGLPGRPGIGIGHNPVGHSAWNSDPDLRVLRSWIGKDVDFYYSQS